MRKPGVVLAGNYNWQSDKIVIYDDELMIDLLEQDKDILVETSQGFDLDINHGLTYPHVTSKGCTVMQALADSGIPSTANVITYMVFRPYPIRISNESIMGERYSGDYDDSVELSWADIEAMSGCKNLTEYTTVTKKIRRVFSFSYKRFYHAVMMNNPNYLVLNFAQHLDARVEGIDDANKLNKLYKMESNIIYLDGINPVLDFKENIESEYGIPIAYIGTGPRESEQIDLSKKIKHRNNNLIDDDMLMTGTSLTYYRRHF
jgi:adenylosuccinate synthase